MPSPGRSTQLLALALTILLASGCKKKEPGPAGDVVATLTGTTVAGTPFDPATLKGKPGLVMFVSPTCPHCVDELTAAPKVAREANANVVAVFIVGKAENAKGVLDHTRFDGPAIIDDGTLKKKYGVRTVPYTVVVDATGHATEALRGAHGASRLAEALDDAR